MQEVFRAQRNAGCQEDSKSAGRLVCSVECNGGKVESLELCRMMVCWKARKNIKDIWARLKSVLIQVEFVRAFRPNLKAINKIELLKRYKRQRCNLGINQIGLFQSAQVMLPWTHLEQVSRLNLLENDTLQIPHITSRFDNDLVDIATT